MNTSNLQSKPSWLDYYPNSEKTTEGVNFGFDSTGMWFSGNSNGISYPIRTNYDISSNKRTEIIFSIIQGNCADHSVCVFNPSIEPQWNWGTDSTRIAFAVNCGGPEINGITMEGEGGGSNLINGETYTCKIVYDPSAGTFSYEVYNGTSATGAAINSLTLNQVLPEGPYRIGFDADQDADPTKSYFTYLSIVGEQTNNYPYPEVVFRVKTYDPLQFVGQNFPDSNINNILLNLQNQTVWIENWPYPLKNGDEFTLYGEQALQTLNAYNQINSGGTQLETLYYGVRGGYDPNATGTGGSMSFNGTTTYLTLPASSDWAVGTGDFTVEWFQYQQETGGDDRIFSVNSWPSASIACSMETSVDTFYFWTNGTLINGGSISSLYNTWAHIAACRSSGTLYLFVNGTEVYSGANTDDITDNTHPLSIGAQSIENNYYQGLITNFQFIKGTALYTTAFTPPTAPISPDANSKLCLLASSESALLTDSSPSAKTATNNGVTFSATTPF
jgi:hypothetical protein